MRNKNSCVLCVITDKNFVELCESSVQLCDTTYQQTLNAKLAMTFAKTTKLTSACVKLFWHLFAN